MKANRYSTQGFDGDSRDSVSEVNTEVPELHQTSTDGTPEFFSFDSPGPPASADSAGTGVQIDQPAAQPYDGYSSGRAYQPRGVYKVLKPAFLDVSLLEYNHSSLRSYKYIWVR